MGTKRVLSITQSLTNQTIFLVKMVTPSMPKEELFRPKREFVLRIGTLLLICILGPLPSLHQLCLEDLSKATFWFNKRKPHASPSCQLVAMTTLNPLWTREIDSNEVDNRVFFILGIKRLFKMVDNFSLLMLTSFCDPNL